MIEIEWTDRGNQPDNRKVSDIPGISLRLENLWCVDYLQRRRRRILQFFKKSRSTFKKKRFSINVGHKFFYVTGNAKDH